MLSTIETPTSTSSRPTIDWLWHPYVARGKLTLLDGDPGFGKSLLTVDLAARLSRGIARPDSSVPVAPCRTLLLSIEDDADDTIWPRLRAGGADVTHVFIASKAGELAQLPDILPALERKIRELNIDLLVLDSLTTLLPASLSSGSAAAVRQIVAPIIQMAIETNIAVVLVRHLIKEMSSRAICRGLGSIGVAGLARTVLLAGPHPTDAAARALTVVKSNLAAAPAPLVYRIGERDGVAVVEWLGPAMLGLRSADHSPARDDAPGVVRATIWLLEALADGPRAVVELLVAAKADGLGERTLEKAKKQAGVISKLSHSKDGRRLWCWCPPGFGEKPFLPPLEFELEPLDDPNEELIPDNLSPEAEAVLARDRLAWASRTLNYAKGERPANIRGKTSIGRRDNKRSS